MNAHHQETYHVVLDQAGGRSAVRPLLVHGAGRLDEESRFLLGASLVAEQRGPGGLLRALRRGGSLGRGLYPDADESASITVSETDVELRGHYVDRLAVSRLRFVEMLEAWSVIDRLARPHAEAEPEPLEDPEGRWDFDDEPDLAHHHVAVIEATGQREVRYRLSDGTTTCDQRRWRGDRAARSRSRADEIACLLVAFGDTALAAGRPTPARLDLLSALVRTGALPAEYAEPFAAAGRLDDAGWQTVKKVAAIMDDSPIATHRWVLEVRIDGEVVTPAGCEQPVAGASPRALMRRLAESLVDDGWEVIHAHTLGVHDSALRVRKRRVVLVREKRRRPLPWE